MTSLRLGLLGTRWPTSLSLLRCFITYIVAFSSEFIVRNWLCFGCPQLVRRRRERDGLGGDHFLDYALPRIVRLTVETNVMTSKYTYPWCLNVNSFHSRSASVGIIALLMMVIFPVGDSREFSVPIWPHVNIERGLVRMPVGHCFFVNIPHLDRKSVV